MPRLPPPVLRLVRRRRMRDSHSMHVLAAHLKPHPNRPELPVKCLCDLCQYCRQLPVG